MTHSPQQSVYSSRPVAEIDLAVTGMTCASCVSRVEKKLNKLPGVRAAVNLANEQAHVDIFSEGAQLSDEDFINQVKVAGYDGSVIRRANLTPSGKRDVQTDAAQASAAEENAELSHRARLASLTRSFWVSLALSIPIVGISMIPALQFPGWQWLVAALSLPVAFWAGAPFHISAAKSLRHGATTMDTLISLGTLAAMFYSLWALLWGGAGTIGYTMTMTGIHSMAHGGAPHLYFESAAMIVTFLLLGRRLELSSRRSAGDALRSLINLGASTARRTRRADGSVVDEVIPAAQLEVGDEFQVAPGEQIASDGVVVTGNSAVDASLLTGESVPVEVGPGAEVTGATVNAAGSLTVRASRVGADTTLAQMGRLLSRAQSGKAPVQALADRISAVFVPAIIAIATGTFAVRLALGNPLEAALTSAITVLVVACPCALGLATPTALMVGSGRAAKIGALIAGPQILESAHRVSAIVLDKTGTLTAGEMVLDGVAPANSQPGSEGQAEGTARSGSKSQGDPAEVEATRGEVLRIAAALEDHSEHPIARAIVRGAQKRGIFVPGHAEEIAEFSNEAGRGVSGKLGDSLIRAGSVRWMDELGVDTSRLADRLRDFAQTGASVVVVARDGIALGALAVRDTLRPEAREALEELTQAGLRPVLATGDNEETARAIAAEAGIADVRTGLLPDQKLQVVEELQAGGEAVAMVGDGVNDAAALAQADLSIAMGSGTDVAKAASNITIVNSDLRTVPAALRISRKTLRVIRENLLWAFGYNLIAVPAAVLGFILPGLAAAAMAGSSVIVVLNSLRLRRA